MNIDRQVRGAPQKFPCPTCGASVGEPCRTNFGRRCHYAHEGRKRLVAA